MNNWIPFLLFFFVFRFIRKQQKAAQAAKNQEKKRQATSVRRESPQAKTVAQPSFSSSEGQRAKQKANPPRKAEPALEEGVSHEEGSSSYGMSGEQDRMLPYEWTEMSPDQAPWEGEGIGSRNEDRIVMSAEEAAPVKTKYGPLVNAFSADQLVYAVVMSEVLGKPKSLQNKK